MQKRLDDLSYGMAVVALTLFVLLLWPELLQNLLSANSFIPHGHCYLWKPELVWLHIVSDSLIGLAYVSISATLAYLVNKSHRDIPFHWVLLAFGLFIVACGTTHFIEVLTLWQPIYWLSGSIKLITAAASITTALALPPLVPQVLALVEAAKTSEERRLKLETANQELAALYEKLKQLDQLKTQFFANVSHELRTPLTLILEPTKRLLKSELTSQEQPQYLKVIHRNARILLKRVNDLLDVSKLEAGKMDVNYTEVDLTELIRLTGAHFETLAKERKISFSVETPPSLPAQVDSEKIQRVCFNLLSNAFKFTSDRGSIRFSLKDLRLTEESATNNLGEIIVEDSGSGVPPKLREVIFERFRQGESGDSRRYGGTGLGLAIAKEFVELHGGTIGVGDAAYGGALFSVQLPLVAPSGATVFQRTVETSTSEEIARQVLAELQHSQTGTWERGEWRLNSHELGVLSDELPEQDSKSSGFATKNDSTGSKPENSAPLVLVVEDNPEMNLFICRTLATEYTIATAFDGREGLEKALRLSPDLILSDIMMPQISGEQMVRELRKYPKINTIPIVVLSAKADDDLRVRMLRNGAQDYLMKPYSSEELLARVGNLIAMKRVREVLQQELSTTSYDLAALATELASRKRELQQLAAELESRVEQRTIELQAANELLKQQIVERQQAEEQIRTLNAELEQRVSERTAELEAANGLKDELLLREQAAQQYYRLLTEAIPQMVWTARPDGYLDYYNQRWFEYTGLSEEESLTAQGWQMALHPDDVDKCVNSWDRAVRTGESHQVECRFKRADGVYRWHLGRALPMRDKDRRVVKWFGTCTDIDDRKRGEEAAQFLAEASTVLAASLDYETTLESLASLAVPFLADYCLIDAIEKGGKLRRLVSRHANPAKEDLVRQLYHYSPEVGKSEGVSNVLQTGKSSIVLEPSEELLEAIACNTDHFRLLCELSVKAYMIVPLLVNKRTLGTIAFVITESCRRYGAEDLALAEELARRAALAVDNARLYREAQEANRMKDEFLAIVSHELRTPMNAVLGWANLLRTRKYDPAKTAQALETIERNAKLQTQLIEDILDVSQMIQGQVKLQIRPVRLSAVIESAIQAVLPTAQTKSVQVEAILDNAVEPVAGDFNRLQQVVCNLLSNAIKFTPAGRRVQVQLSREVGMENGATSQSSSPVAQIQVRDTGKGISPEFLPYVFDQFRQENSTIARSHGGLGLGLAIVRHLVELHDGKVFADSAGEGQGATFTVLLPLMSAESKERKNPTNSSFTAQHSTLTGLQVLVVDEEADTRNAIATVLEQHEAEVMVVASVKEALEALAGWQPDVLLSDIEMAVEDGFRQIDNKILRIALCANASLEDQQRAIAASFHKFISKPVAPAHLVAVVAKLTGRLKKIY